MLSFDLVRDDQGARYTSDHGATIDDSGREVLPGGDLRDVRNRNSLP